MASDEQVCECGMYLGDMDRLPSKCANCQRKRGAEAKRTDLPSWMRDGLKRALVFKRGALVVSESGSWM